MVRKKSLRVASDKSISHRSVMIASIAKGKTVAKNILFSDDTLRTVKAMQLMGVRINIDSHQVEIDGVSKFGLKEPFDVLDLGNSGTSMRLLSGVLAGQNFLSILTGDNSLKRRPMGRIIQPLKSMGAEILSREGNLAPLAIKGGKLSGISHKMKIASAQVKSAVLLAGLYTQDDVEVVEPYKSRNHTENMLKAFGVDIIENGLSVRLGKNRELNGDLEIEVPADISSAAFFMVFAALKKDFEITLKDVGLNETRSGILDIFNEAGVNYEIKNRRVSGFEEIGDIVVSYSPKLKPFEISGEILPLLIDEIPILSILAVYCDGVSVVKDAHELRKKESDRIKSICEGLKRVGVEVEEFKDGFKVYGKPSHPIKNALIETHNDHRIAMSFLVLSAVSSSNLKISETQSILTSYPNFLDHLSYVNG
ncbi:3-phosphoshikimate 1-carboxyvinyltransferase [Hippea maritima]|uniref:3-phosphoshikimate 1-carboxyvinyltransferase n=1 Tax=Hippea maritima (strain ATCC 700847 / DSM 10411 / MH2) TaxID=760142 RepID=F2LUH0_HIPMA|nr:3-phosphoshikimate 1-carboxyvinyltransferase [Hippea maritima]AEA33496.1 3-phosphoshikimate 1-carboxyvinyltransferase [Hippea maritima DSM 10411]